MMLLGGEDAAASALHLARVAGSVAVLIWPAGTLSSRTAVATAAAPAGALVPATPPSGTEGLGAAWYTVATPEGRTLLVAIYDTRSSPDQAVPAIVVLHGTHGFARQYVEIAHDLSVQTGYVVAAGCWFDGVGQDVDAAALRRSAVRAAPSSLARPRTRGRPSGP